MNVRTLLFLVPAVLGILCVKSINATNISSHQTSTVPETTEHKLVEHPSNGTAQAIIRSTQPPEFAKQPSWPNQNYYDEDGPPIKLSCELKSTEGIVMLWYKDDVVIVTRSQIYEFSNRNTTLTITDPKQDQTGLYKCEATNSAGTIYHSGYILITGREQDTRPHITEVNPSSTIIYTDVGHTVNISCTFDVGGTLEALVDLSLDWLMMEDSVNDTDHTTWGIYTDSKNNQVFTLTISNLTHDDYGQYVCYGENQRGNTSRSFSVLSPKLKLNSIDMKVVVAGCVGGAVVMVTLAAMVTYRIKRRKSQQYQQLEWPDIDDRYEVPVRDVEHDVFISYSSEDLTWAKDMLFHNLQEAGYDICIDFKDFVPGCAVTENIMESIYKSKKTIVILSQSFLKSMWGQFELQQAHNRAIIQRQDILILVRIDDSKVPAQLMGKTFLDWSDPNVNPHFWPRLYEAIGQPGHFKDQSNEEEPYTDLNIHDQEEDLNIHDVTDLNIHDVADQQLDNQFNENLHINNETVEENNARNMEYNLEMNFDNT